MYQYIETREWKTTSYNLEEIFKKYEIRKIEVSTKLDSIKLYTYMDENIIAIICNNREEFIKTYILITELFLKVSIKKERIK